MAGLKGLKQYTQETIYIQVVFYKLAVLMESMVFL